MTASIERTSRSRLRQLVEAMLNKSNDDYDQWQSRLGQLVEVGYADVDIWLLTLDQNFVFRLLLFLFLFLYYFLFFLFFYFSVFSFPLFLKLKKKKKQKILDYDTKFELRLMMMRI